MQWQVEVKIIGEVFQKIIRKSVSSVLFTLKLLYISQKEGGFRSKLKHSEWGWGI